MLAIPPRELAALGELARSGVEYLLTGGFAMRHYGVDRRTSDVDVFVGQERANAERLMAAIERIIGHPPRFTVDQLAGPDKHVRCASDGLALDVLTSVPEIDFAEAFRNLEHALEQDVEITVISKADLLAVKRAVVGIDPRQERREKELRDIALLEQSERL